MDAAAEARKVRIGSNQALFRSVNERIEELNEAFDAFTPYGAWVCECHRLGCVEQLQLTLGEYEQVRAVPERFLVAPGEAHVDRAVERVVAQSDRYWLVEKRGAAAAAARELDERSC